MIRLRTLPAGRQEFTLSVAAGRRGTAKAAVRVAEPVPRLRLMGFEVKRRNDLKAWLSAVRGVVEGRSQWPGVDMPAGRWLQCMVRPRITNAQDASASALIDADPATVWEAVHSPETARIVGSSRPIYSGHVPGTPQGEAGEMQYFVSRRANGQLTGSVVVVTEISWQRSALAHDLGPIQGETRYLLTPECDSGPTRLEITHRWPAKLTNDAEAARSGIAQWMQATVSDYKSLIETGDGRASAATDS